MLNTYLYLAFWEDAKLQVSDLQRIRYWLASDMNQESEKYKAEAELGASDGEY